MDDQTEQGEQVPYDGVDLASDADHADYRVDITGTDGRANRLLTAFVTGAENEDTARHFVIELLVLEHPGIGPLIIASDAVSVTVGDVDG